MLLSGFLMGLLFKPALAANKLPQKLPVIRIAVLDNPNMPQQLWLWSRYENAYLAGIETAALAAEKKGYKIEYKTFFYGAGPLDILDQIPKVKAWKPDFILGPHYSNQFLLLGKYFKDVLVISSYASDVSIAKLPDNFYSLFPPDDNFIQAIVKFIQKTGENKNIFLLTQADCKECVSISNLFLSSFEKENSSIKITQVKFLENTLNNANGIKTITKEYHPNDLILIFPATYYIYSKLVSQITSFLKIPDLTYISTIDNWGNSKLETIAIGKSSLKYRAYRITPLIFNLNPNEKKTQEFSHFFFEKYRISPTEAISYMTFLTVTAVISTLDDFPTDPSSITREKVLMNFKKALKKNPNWFRPKEYAVYQYSDKGETLVNTFMAFD